MSSNSKRSSSKLNTPNINKRTSSTRSTSRRSNPPTVKQDEASQEHNTENESVTAEVTVPVAQEELTIALEENGPKEVLVEEKINVNSEEEMDKRTILHVKKQVSMVGLQQSMWMKEHDDIIMRFVKDEDPNNRLLTFHIDSQEKLIVSRDIPPYFVDQLFYMIKKKPVKVEVTNFAKIVQFQLIKGHTVENLLRVMTTVFGPMFFQNNSWPDSIF